MKYELSSIKGIIEGMKENHLVEGDVIIYKRFSIIVDSNTEDYKRLRCDPSTPAQYREYSKLYVAAHKQNISVDLS